jgi:hypothetical protein
MSGLGVLMVLDSVERIVKLIINKDGDINKQAAIFVLVIFALIVSYFVAIPILHGKYLPAPNQPELIYPYEGQNDVEILPTFSWRGGNDESQISSLQSKININLTNLHRLDHEIVYSIYVSNNKTEIEKNCMGSCPGNKSSLPIEYCIERELDANSTYYWKVVADNGNEFNESNSKSSIRTFKTMPKPQIDLKSDKEEIFPGERVHLSWNALNVKDVWLIEKPESSEVIKNNYGANSEKFVAPKNNTDYILTAHNAAGDDEDVKSISVKKEKPVVDYFGAMNSSSSNFNDKVTFMRIGEKVTLVWHVWKAESIWLLPPGSNENLLPRDSREVSPNKSRNYTLFAENKNGSINESVRVCVVRS